ncbi:MAG: hypothetical protein ACXVAX_06055 [Pseudobdellovibrio sp.]
MKFFFSFCILSICIIQPSIVFAIEAPKDMKQFNVNCPTKQIKEDFDNAYHECNRGFIKKDGGCEKFIELFWKLLPEYDCQRNFDKSGTTNYIVPALWLTGDAAMEDYIRLLWIISSGKEKKYSNPLFKNVVAKSQELFSSKEFRKVLDGALAEKYLAKSEQLEKKLKKKRN